MKLSEALDQWRTPQDMKLFAVSYGGSYNLIVARSAHEALLDAAREFFSVRPASKDDIDWHPGGEAALKELARATQEAAI